MNCCIEIRRRPLLRAPTFEVRRDMSSGITPTEEIPTTELVQQAEGDLYRQLLDQLNTRADENGSTNEMDRLIDMRRQLTEFQLHYKFGMDEVLTKINVLREDVPAQPFDRDDLLAQAPESMDGYWQVPRVL